MLSPSEKYRESVSHPSATAENEAHAVWLGLASLLCGVGSVLIVSLYFATYAKGDSGVSLPVLAIGLFALPILGLILAFKCLKTAAKFGISTSSGSLGRIGLIVNVVWALVIVAVALRLWWS